MDGFLIVDKPSGVTSHDVVAFARRRLKMRKIGHAGTLDPLATGILVLGIGAGTRLLEYLIGCEKEYEAQLTFGATSETCDADGTILENLNAQSFLQEELQEILPEFIGEIEQVPPQFSAIKINGKPAYARARAGEKIKMKSRKIRIFSNEITNFVYPQVELKISCGSGTYIRSLARDLGERIGGGAYLSKLRRTQVGRFSMNRAIPLKNIHAENLLPLEAGVIFPQLNLTRIEAEKIRIGQKIFARANEKVAGFSNEKLLAILEIEPQKRLLKPEKVFIKTTEFTARKISSCS